MTKRVNMDTVRKLHAASSALLVLLSLASAISGVTDVVTDWEPVMHEVARLEDVFLLHAVVGVLVLLVNVLMPMLLYRVTFGPPVALFAASLRKWLAVRVLVLFLAVQTAFVTVSMVRIQRLRYHVSASTSLQDPAGYVKLLRHIIGLLDCCPGRGVEQFAYSILCRSGGPVKSCSREAFSKIILPLSISLFSYSAVLVANVAFFVSGWLLARTRGLHSPQHWPGGSRRAGPDRLTPSGC